MVRSFAFSFVPVKSRRGDFNVDVKDVVASVSFSLPPAVINNNGTEEGGVVFHIKDLQVHVSWADVVVKFERIAGRFSTIADLFLNQVRCIS